MTETERLETQKLLDGEGFLNGLLFLASGNVSLLDADHYADVFRKALPGSAEILYTAIEEAGPKRISVWCY